VVGCGLFSSGTQELQLYTVVGTQDLVTKHTPPSNPHLPLSGIWNHLSESSFRPLSQGLSYLLNKEGPQPFSLLKYDSCSIFSSSPEPKIRVLVT